MIFKELHDLLVEYGEIKTNLKDLFRGVDYREIPHNQDDMKIFFDDRTQKLEARLREIEETELS